MDENTGGQSGAQATPEQMPRKHVYVVNGSPDFLHVVRELLQHEKYNVTTTNFAPFSFETIETAQPLLLIIDLIPRERASWDLLRNLRQSTSTRDIPLILVSTTPRLIDEAKDQHEEYGGDRYLGKPFDLEDLLAHIDELIGKPD